MSPLNSSLSSLPARGAAVPQPPEPVNAIHDRLTLAEREVTHHESEQQRLLKSAAAAAGRVDAAQRAQHSYGTLANRFAEAQNDAVDRVTRATWGGRIAGFGGIAAAMAGAMGHMPVVGVLGLTGIAAAGLLIVVVERARQERDSAHEAYVPTRARYDSAVADEKVARFEQERDSRLATEAGDRARVARTSLEVLRMARHVNEKPVGGHVTVDAHGVSLGGIRVARRGVQAG